MREIQTRSPQAKQSGFSDLQTRIIFGGIYVAAVVALVLISDITTVLLACVLSGIGATELFAMLRQDAKLPNEWVGTVGAVVYPIVMWKFGLSGAGALTVVLLGVLLIWYVFYLRARATDVSITFFGALYTGFMLATIIALRESLDGIWGGVLVLGIFASVWANDSFAYLAGIKFGKHKMAPHISPKKSWEGFAAGLLGSVVVWVLLSFIPGVHMYVWQGAFFGLIVGMFAVVGDLVESRIKRNSGVKDSGNILPGHGGILDRVDSMFLAAPTAAMLLFITSGVPYVW